MLHLARLHWEQPVQSRQVFALQHSRTQFTEYGPRCRFYALRWQGLTAACRAASDCMMREAALCGRTLVYVLQS